MDTATLGLIFGLAVPFAGTVLGSAIVMFMSRSLGNRLQKALLGFAAGVMIAASIWSLIVPSIEMASEQGMVAWVPATVGFLAGIFFLLAIDCLLPHIHPSSNEKEGRASGLSKSTMMLFAIGIHNLPEGMAVGAVLAGFLNGDAGITLQSLAALSIGIAIQNIPEGTIVAMPLRASGLTKRRSFAYGTLSGVIEPAGALLMLAITELATPFLPYILAFASGAMMYVVVEELIPDTQNGKHTNIGTVGLAVGFALMMVLDVALG